MPSNERDDSTVRLDDPWAELRTEGGAPLYIRIAAALTRQIEQGQLAPGMPLSPEIELAHRLGVSRHTMRAALDVLVRGGLLERHRGRGTFVARPRIQQSLTRLYSVAHEMQARGAPLETRVVERGRLSVADEWAAPALLALGAIDPTHLGSLLRVRLVEGSPLLLERIIFPLDICPELIESPGSGEDLATLPFYDVLAMRGGQRVTRAREVLHPVCAAGYEAAYLAVEVGTPLFRVERVGFAGERSVEWRQTLARGDRYTYVVDLVHPAGDGGPDVAASLDPPGTAW